MRFGKIHLIPLVSVKEGWWKYQAAESRCIFWERENERSSPYRFWSSTHSHARTRRELDEADHTRHVWREAMNRAIAEAAAG